MALTKVSGDVIDTQTSLSIGSVNVGTSSSTGTASQTLQVTGGAYVSGNLGIGITIPSSKFEIAENTTSTCDLTITNLNTGNNVTKASRIRFRLTDSVGTNKDVAYITAFPNNLDSTNGNYLSFFTRTADATPTEKMRLNNNGVLTIPNQPYFYARGPETTTTLTNGADLNFNNAVVNNGNHYNTTNFRFTAPVGGRYLFTWSVFLITAAGRCTLKVNNASYNNLQMDVGAAMSQSAIIQLNANDFVSVGDWQSVSGGVFYMGHSHFSGILLG